MNQLDSEAVIQKCSVKKLILKICENGYENIPKPTTLLERDFANFVRAHTS